MSVSFLEGTVELKTATTWTEIQEGDKIDSASSIRLSRDSFIEFLVGNRKVVLSSEGTYSLASVLSAPVGDKGKTNSVINKFSKLMDKEAPRSTAVAGVRGDFEGNPEETLWVDDEEEAIDPEIPATEGRTLFEAARYTEAAEKFRIAENAANEGERDLYSYSRAVAAASAGDTITSIKVLRTMGPSGSLAIARAVLLARLDLDTGATREAQQILDDASKLPNLTREDLALIRELKDEAARVLQR
jgi:hypothetical protein